MLVFMFLDVCCVLAAAIFSVLPSHSCSKPKPNVPGCYLQPHADTDCTDATTDCVCLGSVGTAFQAIPLVYAILKTVGVGVLLKMVFRRKRVQKRLQCKGIRQECVYLWRLVLAAVVLPTMGISLVYYVTQTFRKKAQAKVFGNECSYQVPSSWWLLAVLYALMSLMFLVEAIIFVFCPQRYLHGGRYSSGGKDVPWSPGQSSRKANSKKKTAEN